MIEVTEVSIAQLRTALESGQTTAVELVEAYLARIDAYDAPNTATALNAVVVRMLAFISGLCSSQRLSSGPNSQMLAKATCR